MIPARRDDRGRGGSSDGGNALARLRIAWTALAVVAAVWLASCEEDVAGTNDETHTEVAARILMPDGRTPAAGAAVTMVPVGGTVAAGRGQVDADGHPVFGVLPDGLYALTATSGPLASWTDSVKISAGRILLASDDTLEQAGSISGVVLPQPQHDARTIVVNVLGTDAWANVAQDGKFTIPLLGAGVLRLRFATTLPDYSPLFQTVDLPVGVGWRFPDTLRLPYTGVPVVEGLQARADSATGDVLLSWSPAAHPHLVDYVVYRDSASAVEYSTRPFAATAATSWRDTAAGSPVRKQSWKYRVAVRVSGRSEPGDWYEVVQATSVPPGLAGIDSIGWKAAGAPGGAVPGFLAGMPAAATLEFGTDSVRLPVWRSAGAGIWRSVGRSFALRRMGQAVVRAAGFGAGRIWSFGRSAIGDGIEVSWSTDGSLWEGTTIADSLWPGGSGLVVVGSASRVALVAPGARSVVLVGDSLGNWTRVPVTGRVLGVDDSGIWTDGGISRIVRVDASTGRDVLADLGSWSGDSLRTVLPWKKGVVLQAGNRLWRREGSTWAPRSAPPLNAIAASSDQLLVLDTLGSLWSGQ